MTEVLTGLERLTGPERHRIAGRRVGLLCHASSVDRKLRHAADAVAGAGAELARLFGPEHGLSGVAQDMVAVGEDPETGRGVPVTSLYGADAASLRPRREELADLDLLIVDLQDVGARYYTYAWSMVYCLEACAEAGVPVLVCDRPNPLGGEAIEGGAIEDGFHSFVGVHSVPNRHGLTIGELGRLVAAERGLAEHLQVVAMEGWSRDRWFDDCPLPWVLPSPNMPTLETAIVYPGMCLVEGTEVSEGRGTTRPFELFGAPWVAPEELRRALEGLDLPGVAFRSTWFRPQFQKHAGEDCGGLQIHVLDRRAFRPYLTGVAVVHALRRLYPEEFRWRERAYEFVDDVPAFDLLAGNARVREAIEAGADPAEIAATWQADEADFAARREPYLLY